MPQAVCVCVIQLDRAAAGTNYALKAVGLWGRVIGQIVRGFLQNAGHILNRQQC